MKATCRPALAKPHAWMLARDSSVRTTVDKRVRKSVLPKIADIIVSLGAVSPTVIDFNKGGTTYPYVISTFEHPKPLQIEA